jgi:hypothetical protein
LQRISVKKAVGLLRWVFGPSPEDKLAEAMQAAAAREAERARAGPARRLEREKRQADDVASGRLRACVACGRLMPGARPYALCTRCNVPRRDQGLAGNHDWLVDGGPG